MSQASAAHQLLERLPDAASVRAKLERNLAESRLLRRLLKLALEREKLRQRKGTT